MSVSDKFFKIFNLLFPKSKSFSLSIVSKYLYKFIMALTAVPKDFRNFLDSIYLDLFPSTTTVLDKWEEEAGNAFPATSEEDKINDLNAFWKATGGQGKDYIQEVLNNAGFPVQVHENNPAVDPDIFLNSIPFMVCGGIAAYAGNDTAFAGKTGGDLLVNGPVLTNIPLYISSCNNENAVCGNDLAQAGYFNNYTTIDKIYEITDNIDLWGAFFFIGGDATRDPVTNELTFIEKIQISTDRKNEFNRLILSLKPAQTWVGLLIDYI